jgi:hypothetical protein
VALDDRYANKFTPLDSTAIYPKSDHKLIYTPMIGEMKCPRLYLCLAHSILSPLMLMQHMHQPITNDMIHFISSRDHIGSSILTSLALHRCFGPSAPSHHSTCPLHLQPVRRAKPHLDLLHLVTWLHVMSHMQSAPSSHVWALPKFKLSNLHGTYCSHACTCGLITCVSHSNTY